MPIPPSESTMSILRSYKSQLDDRVASGHLNRAQARDLYYAKLMEIQPPLPGLGALLEFRKQVDVQVEAKTLSLEQADARLKARESEMLVNWEEMAARYAREQREIQRLRNEYERGYWEQKQIEQGEKVFRDRPRF
jgi:hypothetical protein